MPLFFYFWVNKLSECEQENLLIDCFITFLVLQLTWHLFLSSGSVGNTTLLFIYLIMYTPDWLGWPKTIRVEAAYAVYLFTCLPVFFEGMGFFLKTGYLWHPGRRNSIQVIIAAHNCHIYRKSRSKEVSGSKNRNS